MMSLKNREAEFLTFLRDKNLCGVVCEKGEDKILGNLVTCRPVDGQKPRWATGKPRQCLPGVITLGNGSRDLARCGGHEPGSPFLNQGRAIYPEI
ncbi:hypothetical protein RRG08_041416 [Elysia crispata]|uniref:Uncharacterized protein n=1 Tax=Elysia crispata TaxID=231223 RepID=A0AAE0XRQ6_9GAST|nr:hypothetical protein RRG08_041416 [Elysia crispata]